MKGKLYTRHYKNCKILNLKKERKKETNFFLRTSKMLIIISPFKNVSFKKKSFCFPFIFMRRHLLLFLFSSFPPFAMRVSLQHPSVDVKQILRHIVLSLSPPHTHPRRRKEGLVILERADDARVRLVHPEALRMVMW